MGYDFSDWVHQNLSPRPDEYKARYTRFVITEDFLFRKVWTVLITLGLVYTGTIFIWFLCFVDFRINLDPTEPRPSNPIAVVDLVVYVFFVVDLFLGFFFSFRDASHNEVVDLPRCVCYYVRTALFVNILASLPMFSMNDEGDHSNGSLNQAARALRLQRLTRLIRLFQFKRESKRGSSIGDWSSWAEQFKLVRILNLSMGLLWIVHICACGWYLCAALHTDPNITWVARRLVGVDGDEPLADRSPFDCWLHSMYFVVTVFTTVGFGDMSAFTNGEIVYVIFLMIVGIVVHSIIISNAISIVTSNDRVLEFVNSRKDLVDAFAEHTELDKETDATMKRWIYSQARFWMKQQYPKEDMKQLIVGKYMPRELAGQIPHKLFGGQLIQNRLLRGVPGAGSLPPRLPMLLALSLARSDYACGDVVLESGDYPFNLFLVLKGTFAYMKLPAPCQETCSDKRTVDLEKFNGLQIVSVFGPRSYFGDLEIFKGTPRKNTCVCLTPVGTVLIIQRHEFEELLRDFPAFARVWEQRALRRAWVQALREHTIGEVMSASVEEFAAVKVQRFMRWYWNATRPGDPTSQQAGPPRHSRSQLQGQIDQLWNLSQAPAARVSHVQSTASNEGRGSSRRDTCIGSQQLEVRMEKIEKKVDRILGLLVPVRAGKDRGGTVQI